MLKKEVKLTKAKKKIIISKIIKIDLDNNIFILNNFRELLIVVFFIEVIIELTPIKKITSHMQSEIILSGIDPMRVVINIPPLKM